MDSQLETILHPILKNLGIDPDTIGKSKLKKLVQILNSTQHTAEVTRSFRAQCARKHPHVQPALSFATQSMNAKAKAAVTADCDACDSYNACVRPVLLYVGLPMYLAYLAVNVSRMPKVQYGHGTAGTLLNSTARDSGLRMEITSPFPEFQLIMHGVSAVLLFVLIVIQKESVRAMLGAPATCPNLFSWSGITPIAALRWHRRIGRCCCVLMLLLAAPGFLLCRYSSWEHFEMFAYFFAAPWLCWAVSIYLTATPRLIHMHRFVGNMALKGCIAVPLSRIAGATLQERGWGEEQAATTSASVESAPSCSCG